MSASPTPAAAPWTTLPLEVADAATLLARSRWLLEEVRRSPVPVLRWYRATTPALVLGRGQRPPDPGDLAVTVRASGGGAVLLDEHVLSLDMVVPAGHPWLHGGLGDVFLRAGDAWARTLVDLGVPSPRVHGGASPARRRGSERERLLADVCYATVGRGEVTVAGRKLVGLAQRRRRHGALVQCGLLRRWRPARLLAALGADPGDADVARAAVGLDDLVTPAPTDRSVMTAMARALGV